MTPTKDIHDYNAKYESALRQVKKSDISDKNKELILDFDRACFLEALSKPRRIRLIRALVILAKRYLRKDFDKAAEKDNPESALWVMAEKDNKYEMMKYGCFRALVLRLKEKAKIKKRLYHHLFRHTRVTHLLINRQISEAQAKVYFGWVPSSKMLAEYSHLISSDVNDAILEIHGIKKTKEKESLLKPKQCQSCGAINSKDALFCQKCSKVLDVKTAIELDEKRKSSDEIITALAKNPKSLKKLAEILSELGLTKRLMEI